MECRFSIVVPVYNVAPFLPACLESVRSQSFADWECVCVDDGSRDASGQILDDWAARDPRFRVIHQPNGGVSVARNRALDAVTGEYFLFLDGDDLLMADALAQLDAVLRKTEADGLLCWDLFTSFPEDAPAESLTFRASLDVAGARRFPDRRGLVIGANLPLGYSAGRVYRTDLFRTLRFPLGVKMMEDVWFWADAVAVEATWARVDGRYLAYRTRAQSAAHVKDAAYFHNVLKVPTHAFPVIFSSLGLSAADAKRAWRPYVGVYAGFIRSLTYAWRTFTGTEKADFRREFAVFLKAFPFYPFAFLTRVRLFCTFRNLGTGAWVDWIEGPLTRSLNALRTLKRRMGR